MPASRAISDVGKAQVTFGICLSFLTKSVRRPVKAVITSAALRYLWPACVVMKGAGHPALRP